VALPATTATLPAAVIASSSHNHSGGRRIDGGSFDRDGRRSTVQNVARRTLPGPASPVLP
jgi:hypothetical protein